MLNYMLPMDHGLLTVEAMSTQEDHYAIVFLFVCI